MRVGNGPGDTSSQTDVQVALGWRNSRAGGEGDSPKMKRRLLKCVWVSLWN